MITNDSVEEKKYFTDLFAGDYLHDTLCETWVTIYTSDNTGDFVEPILDTVGFVDGVSDYIGAEEINDYMKKNFNARPALIEYV